jgi:GxxExxY protein
MTLIDTGPYSRRIIGWAIEVHKTFGPGLTGSIDETELCGELDGAKSRYTRQQKLPVTDKDDPLFRMDLVVEDAVWWNSNPCRRFCPCMRLSAGPGQCHEDGETAVVPALTEPRSEVERTVRQSVLRRR